MPEKKIDSAVFIPPEGVALMTNKVTYHGRWYEDLGTEEVGGYDDPLTGEHLPGREVQKYGRLLQVVDDGNPKTPVWYEPFDGDEKDYTPVKRDDKYEANVEKYIAGDGFAGHPTEPED